MIRHLSYEQALSNIERTLVKGKVLKADVFVASVNGRRYVVKDFGRKGFFERHIVGRVIVAREFRAYRSLSGVSGVPSEYKRLTPFSIAIEYLEGRDLGSIDRGSLDSERIRQLESLVKELHGRGWVHLDLQRRSNILLVGDRIFVVDLASAFHPGGVPVLGRFLTSLLALADRMSLIKMKSIYAPDLMTGRERQWLRLRNLVMPRKW